MPDELANGITDPVGEDRPATLRYSGVCKACGAPAWQLIPGPVPASARHTHDQADHEVVVVAAPLNRMVKEATGG